MRVKIFCIVVSCVFPVGVLASDEVFPVEAVLGAPFPVEIAAAPGKDRIAFVLNDRGVRNIWIADGPEYEAKRLTAYKEDDGVELTGLAFTPDATRIVFRRGAGPNRSGEFPNPRSFPEGTEMALWVVDVDDAEPRKIGNGSGAAIHPDGESVAFVNKGEVWLAELDPTEDEEEDEPESIIKARGGLGQLRWSPDGSMLAFRSNRETHSYVGVWRRTEAGGAGETTGKITWLSPSVDRDGEAVWSPEGTRVAFLRQPTLDFDRFPFAARRADEPWSILVADVATGDAREIWRAREGVGSAYWSVVARQQLFWGIGDRVVFAWERDGWNHLYSVSIEGGDARLLTPGAFEIEHVAMSQDARHIYFSSNEGDIDRRHIWRVGVDRGPAVAVTRGDGIEWSPQPIGDGSVAILRSDARRPARAAVVRTDGAVADLAPGGMPKNFPLDEMVVPQPVTVTAVDGLEVHAQLFLPKDLKAGDRRPAAIFLHGGSRRQMLLGWHKSSYYHNAYGMSQYLVSRGFIALALNYRSGIGYGMEFREAENYGATGASEFKDVMGAGLYLKGRPDVDAGRIGVWGGSYGGFLTAHALAQASDLFAAGVDVHGVHDWNEGIRIFMPRYDPKDYPEKSRIAAESSPMHYVDGWRSPVLLIHGDDDRNVFFSQTTRLVRELRKRGVEFEQLVFPDEVHGFLLHENWVKAYRATANFLVRKLGD